jgi:anthranilate phosphoribosyltransferase
MKTIFDKMSSLSCFSQEDFEHFFTGVSNLAPVELGAILGYLLGRADSRDAAAMVAALRGLHPQHSPKPADGRPTVNLVGTGGGPSTFNVTTTSAFVVAAAGVAVLKTGSAARRSKSGFFDVAVRLGTMKLSMSWDLIQSILDDVGIVFIPLTHYAPALGQLEQAAPPEFYRNAALYLNKIGPLLSPVKVDCSFIGADSIACLEMLAGVCLLLGDTPAVLVSAEDGLDEVSTMARTQVIRLSAAGRRENTVIDPRELGIQPPSLESMRGHDPAAAAECCERILSGQGKRAQTEIVALNAGVVLNCLGMCADLPSGFQAALEILKKGEALAKLRQLQKRVWK